MAKLKLVADPGKHDIRMWRDFDAPRELVFRAFTDPDLVPRWWGPHSVTTTVDQMEVRKGGIWRYIQRDDNGNEFIFSGVYHDIVTPERIVFTFEFEGLPGHVLLETVTFEDYEGKTRITDSSVFQTVKDRDGMIQAGMERGAEESWERFEELIKRL